MITLDQQTPRAATVVAPAPKPVFAAAPRRKSPLKWILLAAAVVLIAGTIFVVNANKRRNALVPVVTEKAIVKTITQTVSATGKIQPEMEVNIAPEVSGEIVQLAFREGAVVKKGDLLAAIKPDSYQAQVEQQEATLVAAKAGAVQAKAQLAKAQDDLGRATDLFQKRLVSESDFNSSKTAVEVAQANYDAAVASIRRTDGSLRQAQDQLAKTMIYSPVDGKVTALTTEVGERVAGTGSYGGAEIMRVADLAKMEVRVNVNENDIVNVKVGDKARITIDAFPNRKFTGQVKEIGAAAKPQAQNTQDEVTNFLVKIRILDKDAPLRPSMSANAEIETKTVANAVVVPVQSVTVRTRTAAKTPEEASADRQKQAEKKGEGAAPAVNVAQQRQAERADRDSMQRGVFVYGKGKVRWVPVETGLQDLTHIEIKSGLKAGDDVVSGSFAVISRTLKDGMPVTVDRPKKKG